MTSTEDDEDEEINRRQFLRNVILGTGALGAAGALDGFIVEPRWLEVTHHEIEVADLPAALDGYRIAHVSDVHLASLGAIHEDIVDALDRAEPQLVLITGDMIDDRTKLADVDELCGHISRSGRRIVATLGNWEHWSDHDIKDLAEIYTGHGIELLVNESLVVDGGIVVAGTDDGASGHADLAATVRSVGDGDVRLLLSHAPGIFEAFADIGMTFDLTLSGHTHGGQVRIGPFAPVRPPGSGRFVSGMYQTSPGRTYVSRGLGTSILPVRFLCRPELPIFELRG